FLRQLADLQPRGPPDFAVIGHLVSLDQAQHARFACTVATDDAYPLAPSDLPGDTIEQGHGAIGEGYVGKLQQCHGAPPETGGAFYPSCAQPAPPPANAAPLVCHMCPSRPAAFTAPRRNAKLGTCRRTEPAAPLSASWKCH